MLYYIYSIINLVNFMKKYSAKIESDMKNVFNRLNEKDKRRYAAVEVNKLGHGGKKYISELLGITPKTISKGQLELEELKKKLL